MVVELIVMRGFPQKVSRRHFLGSGSALAVITGSARLGFGQRVAPWVDQVRAGPFLCRSHFRLDVHQDLFEELAHLQSELTRTLGVQAAQKPIDLFFFSDQASYQKYFQRTFPEIPYRRALFVKTDGHAMVFAYRHGDFYVDVRHESTHALLHAVLPRVPLWLDEGLAEYFELPAPERPGGQNHLSDLRWNMRLGIFPTLASLERCQEIAEMRRREYRFSWAWVHFMLHGPVAAHRVLVQTLADIGAARAVDSLDVRLHRAIPEVESRFIAHFKTWPAVVNASS